MRAATTIASVLFAGALVGCGERVWPGQHIGTYHVTGEMAQNTCGNNLGFSQSVTLDVELRSDGEYAYWRHTNTASIITGVWDSNSFMFGAQTVRRMIEPNQFEGIAGCILNQDELISGTVSLLSDGGVPADATVSAADAAIAQDAGSADALDGGSALLDASSTPADAATDAQVSIPYMNGTHTVTFTPQAGSVCTAVVVPAGTYFNQLPCTISYTLHGTDSTVTNAQ